VAKKAKAQAPTGGDTLGDIAAGLGSLLGNAEKQWRAWQGPREAVVQAVTDVRDRAVALLSEMDVAGLGSKKSKKDKKKAKKADKKKADKAAKAEKPAKAAKAEKKAEKAGKKKDKADKKAGKKAKAAASDVASEA
jgi:hypothetical protein